MRPILTRSEITGSVYITTKYKAIGSGELDTYEKYDVTHEFDIIAGGIVAENERLSERHAKAVAETEIWNAQWEAEHIRNAELLELVKALVAVADLRDCEECPCQYTPDCVECDEALPTMMMRELGIKVGDGRV